jgi:hypothetical protein
MRLLKPEYFPSELATSKPVTEAHIRGENDNAEEVALA